MAKVTHKRVIIHVDKRERKRKKEKRVRIENQRIGRKRNSKGSKAHKQDKHKKYNHTENIIYT